MLTYKILFGLVDVVTTQLFDLVKLEHYTRGYCYKLSHNHVRVDIRKYFFAERVITPWNSLNALPQDFYSLKTFKKYLMKTDLNKFLTVY